MVYGVGGRQRPVIATSVQRSASVSSGNSNRTLHRYFIRIVAVLFATALYTGFLYRSGAFRKKPSFNLNSCCHKSKKGCYESLDCVKTSNISCFCCLLSCNGKVELGASSVTEPNRRIQVPVVIILKTVK
jgi:hypothetical protein